MAKIATPPPMSAREYRDVLAALGQTPLTARHFLRIGQRTSYRYASEGGIPDATAMLLRLMLAKNVTPTEAAALPPVRAR